MAEARFHPRLRIHANADIIGTEVLLAAPVEDVSLGGCKFSGPAWEVPGTNVEVVISFPELRADLPLQGVVVRSSHHDMAIRFVDLSDEQFGALRQHLHASREPAN